MNIVFNGRVENIEWIDEPRMRGAVTGIVKLSLSLICDRKDAMIIMGDPDMHDKVKIEISSPSGAGSVEPPYRAEKEVKKSLRPTASVAPEGVDSGTW